MTRTLEALGRQGAALFFTVVACGCSSESRDAGASSDSGMGGGPGAQSSDPLFDDLGTGGAFVDSGSVGIGERVLPGTECAAAVYRGETIPVDLYLMMDRSISMGDAQEIYLIPGGGTKWAAVIEGIETFVDLPDVAGAQMGMDFFGLNDGDSRCDTATYSTPEVEPALLPQVGKQILDSFAAFSPGGNTPLTPALEGAIAAARRHQSSSGRRTIVVLATDGKPNGCGSNFDNLVSAASAGFEGDPSVQTFVLGITGQELEVSEFEREMKRVAEAGGSQALFIDANSELGPEFAAALGRVYGGAAVPCQFAIPTPQSGAIAFDRVNIAVGRAPQDPSVVPRVSSPADCGTNTGWYYDDSDNPQIIQLCPTTCDTVSSENGMTVDLLVGCRSQIR